MFKDIDFYRSCVDGWTLGFALAKGLIRGLTCCSNPSSKILVYYQFLDVSWRSLCLCPSASTVALLHLLDSATAHRKAPLLPNRVD